MKNLNSIYKTGTILIFLGLFYQLTFSQTTELISFINSGTKFQVELKYDRGTLVAGETYDVVYTNGEFYVTGFNSGTKSIGTWTYKNADPNLSEISLWGAVYIFDGNGNIYDKDKGLSGKITIGNWISYIKSGSNFKARLDYNYGTLVAGETYDVIYTKGEFTVTGYNRGTESIGTWNYKNADPDLYEISLWGAKFKFNDLGILYDSSNTKCGTIFK
jgi:hypothetical protein